MQTRPRIPRLAPLLLGALLASCLENEEELDVHPDGSVTVTLSSHGDVGDLADGYPVPLEVPWEPVGPDTAWWLRELGEETGGPFVQERLPEARRRWKAEHGDDADPRLVVRRTFGSVADLPRWVAPESAPYRTAHLERETSLERLARGGRTVYVFERRYPRRPGAGLDPLTAGFEALPEGLQKRLENEEVLTDAELATVAEGLGRAHGEAAQVHARHALVRLFVDGDASLAPPRVERILESVRSAVVRIFDRNRLARVLAWSRSEPTDEGDPDGIVALERDYRTAVRETLARHLDEAELAVPTRNGVLAALEWSFASVDHTDDLGDEKFRLLVRLPGIVIDGNHTAVEGGALVWEFEGKDLHDRDLVLRAVSVLE